MKLRQGIAGLTLTFLLLTTTISCRYVMPERYANYNWGRVNVDLPRNIRNADTDINVEKDSAVVISLTDDEKIFVGRDHTPIAKGDLGVRLKQLVQDRRPDDLVYLAIAVYADYGAVVETLNELRKQNVANIGLLVERAHATAPSRFAVEIPQEPNPTADTFTMPEPLTLVVSITPDLKLRLNMEDFGDVTDPAPLSEKLLQIFQQRTETRAYRPGFETRSDLPESDRVEKSIFIKAARSMKYGDVVKVIDAVKGAGAAPIVLQIDNLPR